MAVRVSLLHAGVYHREADKKERKQMQRQLLL